MPEAAPAQEQSADGGDTGRAAPGGAGGTAPEAMEAGSARRGAARRVVRLAPETPVRYHPEAKKTGKSALRLLRYRSARTVGEFFDLHPGTEGEANADLANDLKKGLCATDPPLGRGDFDSVAIDQAGRACAGLAAVARGRATGWQGTAPGAAGSVASRNGPGDPEMPRRSDGYAALVPEGTWGGFQGCDSVDAECCAGPALRENGRAETGSRRERGARPHGTGPPRERRG